MARYNIDNMTNTTLVLPPPIGRTVKPRGRLVLDTPAALMDVPEVNELISRGLCAITAANDPLTSNQIEIIPSSASGGAPGGTSGQIQYNNAGTFSGSPITADGTNNLAAGNGAWALEDNGSAHFGNGYTFINEDVETGNVTASAAISGDMIEVQRYGSYGAAPGIVAGAGAGTGPTVGIVGTQVAGEITVTVGTAPATGAAVVTMTYANSFQNDGWPVLQPGNAATALLSDTTQVHVTHDGNGFIIVAGSAALPAGTYVWIYNILGT